MNILILLIFYIAVVYILDKKIGLFSKKAYFRVYWFLSIIPIILIGTNKGQMLLDKIANKKKF